MGEQLSGPVLGWVREAFPAGIPDDDAAALCVILRERLGSEGAVEVLTRLHRDDLLSDAAMATLVPDEERVRRVASLLALGGWPLAGRDDDEEDEPPREGSPLARIVSWLREGYPGGVPEHDYLPLLALLERRLTRSEVKKIAKALRRAEVSPAGPEDIAEAITSYTRTEPNAEDLRRVRDQLAKKGWPVEFPDPELPD